MDPELHAKTISVRFKTYSSDMKDVWESYIFINKYMHKIHSLVKNNKLPTFTVVPLAKEDGKERERGKINTYGYIDQIVRKVNPERSLITAVSLTEVFLQDMIKNVYMAYPCRLASGDSKDSPERINKIIDLIIKSEDKEEIIDRLIEEKVRGIFYGNPVDFFLKDKKLGLNFGNTFKDQYADCLDAYSEIIARRNIYAHNGGKIDRKYLKETSCTSLL